MNNVVTNDKYTYELNAVDNVEMHHKAKINKKVTINYSYLNEFSNLQ
jgi:hypothetical protein